MAGKILKDRKGVKIREGCVVRTKALRNGQRDYEEFKVIRVHNKLSVQKRDAWGNLRIYSIDYLQRWMRDDSMEVVEGVSAE